jgi:hypothetical protein
VRIACTLLTASGTAILGVSERHYLLAVVAVLVSGAALVLCDLKHWIELTTFSSNIAALIAMAAAIIRFNTLAVEEQILAVADLLSYLQFILLFKTKTVHNYWLLAVVSFLQVSVAAALHTGLFFAVMLVGYLFIGVYFLTMFYLYREQQRYTAKSEMEPKPRVAWFLVGSAATPHAHGSQIQREPAREQSRELSRRVADLGFGTIALAAFIFIVVPRIGQTQWNPTGIVSARTVGFSSEINLTRVGEIIEDPEIVLRLQFFDPETGEPYQVDGEPYLRGTSVSFYEQGRWRRTQASNMGSAMPRVPGGDQQGYIVQHVTIEPLSSSTLFACAPAFTDEPLSGVVYNARSGRIDRSESNRTRRFTYDLLTPAFRNHRQTDFVPVMEMLTNLDVFLRLPEARDGIDPLDRLKAQAAAVTADIPATDPVRRAKALESYLRDSGRFQYTLQGPERPEGVDPLEDFVARNPRGHCEYFAGALALMLRSQGIPARVVLGYRGGDWNVVGGFYQMRQLNAHSWVEAYLPPSDGLGDRFDSAELKRSAQLNGAWLQLDPTTSFEVTAAAAGDSRWGELKQVVDYLRFLWNNYVVGMDAAKQQDAVYLPLVTWTNETFQELSEPETWLGWYRAARNWLDALVRLPFDVPLFGRRGGLLLISCIAAAWAMGLAVYLVRRRRRRKLAAKTGGRDVGAPPIDFYVRLEAALEQRKLVRTAEQTQREFVQAACGELAESPATRGVAQLPRRIVEAFYRVRFGGRTLDAAELSDVEQALSALNAALATTNQATT